MHQFLTISNFTHADDLYARLGSFTIWQLTHPQSRGLVGTGEAAGCAALLTNEVSPRFRDEMSEVQQHPLDLLLGLRPKEWLLFHFCLQIAHQFLLTKSKQKRRGKESWETQLQFNYSDTESPQCLSPQASVSSPATSRDCLKQTVGASIL